MIENLDYIHAAAYVGVASILILLVPMVLSDIKCRRVPGWAIWLLAIINIPALYILYSNGLPIFYALLSIAMTLLFGIFTNSKHSREET